MHLQTIKVRISSQTGKLHTYSRSDAAIEAEQDDSTVDLDIAPRARANSFRFLAQWMPSLPRRVSSLPDKRFENSGYETSKADALFESNSDVVLSKLIPQGLSTMGGIPKF